MKNKKLMICILIVCILLIPYVKSKIEYMSYYYSFTEETREWLDWYTSLTKFERAAISYFPHEVSKAIENGFDFKY